MKKIMVIMKKDLKETFRTRAFYVNIGTIIFMIIMLGWTMEGEIGTLVKKAEIPAIQVLLGTFAYMLSLMVMMLFCIYLNAYTLTMEKVKRSIESLLCTPLTTKQICIGKTLAIFLPSLILGWLLTFGCLVGINQFLIVPKVGQFIMPGVAPLVAILIAEPLIIFFLSLLVIALQLIITNIRWINSALIFLVFIVGFGLSPILGFGPGSWSIVFVSFGIAGILALIAFLLSSRITKERIVLSSKG